MFNNDKQKILLILKDKLIFYLDEELKYKEMNNEWKNKLYENNNCYSAQKFEQRKKEQIDWSYEQWKLNYNNSNIIKDLIKEIENI